MIEYVRKIKYRKDDLYYVRFNKFRRKNENEWDHYSFRGSKWQHRNKAEQKRYLVNAYRVLLTRARQGMIIFVPRGADEEEDPTRNSTYYDAIYEYLLKCGLEEK